MDVKKASLALHKKLKGKIGMRSRVSIDSHKDLEIIYSPGVAEPCLAIEKDLALSYVYTRRHNSVAIITDGSAVLGLGNIGPEASMPVMEGKAALLKHLGDVDAIPLCLKTQEPNTIVSIVHALSGNFSGINLEDIAAPRCFEIEALLKERCDIPIFHDDQHGTAIAVLAGMINALKLTNKTAENIKVVINGIGAAGSAIAESLMEYGVKELILCDKNGILSPDDSSLFNKQKALAQKTNPKNIQGDLKAACHGADMFIGVSVPNCLTIEAVKTMKRDPIIFALANPKPEIASRDAFSAGAKIVATGLSNTPNQINNLLAFPGIFRGALDASAGEINKSMMIAAAQAIASCVSKHDLSKGLIVPSPLNKTVHQAVAKAVKDAALSSNVKKTH